MHEVDVGVELPTVDFDFFFPVINDQDVSADNGKPSVEFRWFIFAVIEAGYMWGKRRREIR